MNRDELIAIFRERSTDAVAECHADTLLPLINAALADAWDEGEHSGWAYGLRGGWEGKDRNPYRTQEVDSLLHHVFEPLSVAGVLSAGCTRCGQSQQSKVHRDREEGS